VPVRRSAEITGLVHNSGRVLPRIDVLAAFSALPDLSPDALDAHKKLAFVVERGHYYMPPLPPRRVIAVVTDDKALNCVVLRVNSGHRPKVKTRHYLEGNWRPALEENHEPNTRASLRSSVRTLMYVSCAP
jgi:hypothetical protein